MDTPKYDDSATGGYSYLEKLALVAQGSMDPKEIGMADANEAHRELMGEPRKAEPYLGDWITFEASVVPMSIRSRWARQDLKIVPTNTREWEAEWAEQHKDEFRVQAIMRSGNIMAQLDQTFVDPIKGFGELLRKAADALESRYETLKKESKQPIKTRDDIANELAVSTAARLSETSND